ncbi:hypothetical protein X566_21570 [Afipia sp. P52-10]|jgi:predicted secreted protein|uniref:DUF1467 family protein n=1 Tax=Afipia sp. P52-10 TaxID=1429916 RepID=UPI0003DF2C06|nr:DUF1467 family protein [Afipia sp. P52-10]ETR75314.1 hypothetical protein X566_21570 [Afipia sp. P52-10]
MTISSALAIYFVVWWVVLFAVLPFGIRSQAEEGGAVEGTDPGAPIVAGMRAKLLWTTLISAILFAAGWFSFRTGFISLELLSQWMGFRV